VKPHMAVAPINIVSVKEAITANAIRDTRTMHAARYFAAGVWT